MTASTFPTTLDVSSTPRVPSSRLVRVELRKLVDTRASRWLLITIAAITALIILLVFWNARPSDRNFGNFMGATATPQSYLLPVLGILLVTQEWTQRTALVSFTLVPARGRVLLAKIAAALLAGLAAIVLAMVIASLATLVGGAHHGWTNVGLDDVGKYTLLQAICVMEGLAFGLLFLNSAAAIVVYFVAPAAFSIVAALWSPLRKAAPWLDLNTSRGPLYELINMSAQQWLHLAAGVAIWVLLPLAIGLVRMLRAEVK